jgi:mRNA interferase MazF
LAGRSRNLADRWGLTLTSPTTTQPKRGEIYSVDFTTSTGHEMSGIHPCVIVQNDVGNKFSGLTIVVVVTSNLRVASLPIGVFVKAGSGGLIRDSVINCGHIYTVDKNRLAKLIGQLSPNIMAEVDQALTRSLALPYF